MKIPTLSRYSSLLIAVTLFGCTQQPLNKEGDFGALRSGVKLQEDGSTIYVPSEAIKEPTHSRFTVPPRIEGVVAGTAAGGNGTDELVENLSGEPIQLNANNLPLSEFIHEVFGRQLGLAYLIDPSLNKQKDLVTLNLTESLPPADLFRTARSVLAEYGVGITPDENLLKFRSDKDAATADVPLIISGRTLPEVPPSHRPVFTMVPLKVVRNVNVSSWVKNLFKGNQLRVLDDLERNAVILQGPIDVVRQAAEAISFFDQPLLRGRHSLVITPLFAEVGTLSKDLHKVLSTEGYSVSDKPSSGAVILFPLESQESLMVFANSQSIINHIKDWVEQLDTRYQSEVVDGIFSYQAQNVTADHIAQLLAQLNGEPSEGGSSASKVKPSNESGGQSGDFTESYSQNSVLGIPYEKGRLVVDSSRNVLFYKGTGQKWTQIQQAIKEIDQPIPSVLVEVLLAEVTLNSEENTGVEWAFANAKRGGHEAGGTSFSSKVDFGLGGSGLSLTFNRAGETRALINAFKGSGRAVIRSSPKILVKSGAEATIEVGNEIPVFTSDSQSVTDANAPVIRTVQYRKTGVMLNILPVVQASGLVDIKISQELSEEQKNDPSNTGSPIILNRRLETEISLRDGGSVLLGGLISTSKSKAHNTVPGLHKIPILGRLFRADTETETRTELLVLLIPYVINQHTQAEALTESLRNHLTLDEK